MNDNGFWKWLVDGALAIFAGTSGWLMWVSERRRYLSEKQRQHDEDVAKAAKLVDRLVEIERGIAEVNKNQKASSDERKMMTRQIYAMRRDLDKEYVREPQLNNVIKDIKERLDQLTGRIDRALEGRNEDTRGR